MCISRMVTNATSYTFVFFTYAEIENNVETPIDKKMDLCSFQVCRRILHLVVAVSGVGEWVDQGTSCI